MQMPLILDLEDKPSHTILTNNGWWLSRSELAELRQLIDDTRAYYDANNITDSQLKATNEAEWLSRNGRAECP